INTMISADDGFYQTLDLTVNYGYEPAPYGVPPHAHQLKNLHYPQVSKNVILSKKLARKDDIFYESFNSR
ncbi:hypothetical protein P9010_29600, partial [Bacillus thuringiensis]